MKRTARFARLLLSLAGLLTLGWVLTGQAAKPAKQGFSLSTDWSHNHLIFSAPATEEDLAEMSQNPRYWQQLLRRQSLVLASGDEISPQIVPDLPHPDWAVNLGTGASAGAGNYPAKYSLSVNSANCSTDYVVYSTGLKGTGTQASIVAFNNLYGGCGGTVPSVYWAYNTSGSGAGTVLTSPLISLDGLQVAFVQTNGVGAGSLVLLKWKSSTTQTVSSPGAPTSVSAGSYRTCTAPCMTLIGLQDQSGTQTDDTTSSVYYDYTNDIAWVGGAFGWLHKITGIFKGTPAEVKVAGRFPVQVNAASAWISSPVYDGRSNNVFVGDSGGIFYAVNATTAAVTASGQLDFGTGLVDGPVVDSAHKVAYVFASSDGTANCTAGAACAAVYQLSTTFGSGTTGTKTTVGTSVVFGTLPNPNALYIGAFDTTYYASLNATGNLYVCGNTGADATLYQIPIAAGVLPAAGTAITNIAAAASTAACSPITDIPNSSTSPGPSERIFLSAELNGRPTACANKGCVFNFVVTPWQASTKYNVGQEILSSKRHIEMVLTGGTSGLAPPNWSAAAGATRNDNNVVWIDQGPLNANALAKWKAGTAYAVNARVLDTNNNVEIVTTPGTSGASAPGWNLAAAGTTTDNTVTWTNIGLVPMFSLQMAGGTSGVIEDNAVQSPSGSSQIYFTTLGSQVCGTSGTGGCAVQASQTKLQ
jgi:hypothetical protein